MIRQIWRKLPWNRKMELLHKKIESQNNKIESQNNKIEMQNRILELQQQKIEQLQLDTERLFHEKHEMILQDRKKIEDLQLYAQSLFHEKHEMILHDRLEIRELVRLNILRYYEKQDESELTEELAFLKKHPLCMYPYDWTMEYKDMPVDCFEEDGWLYILHNNKKMYFPRKYTVQQAKEYYRFLVMEQDKRSPHFYGFSENISPQTVFVDVGAAEGLISLDMIEKVEQALLFECDLDWAEALEKTFSAERYEKKVHIISKFVGEAATDHTICLRDILKEPKLYMIKIDVEGNEADVLKGLRGIHMSKGSCMMICCYHHQKDEELIVDYVNKQGMRYQLSDGYLLSTWGGYEAPYFRRGICRAYCCDGDKILT